MEKWKGLYIYDLGKQLTSKKISIKYWFGGELKSKPAFTVGFRKDGGDGLLHEQLILARKRGRKPSRLHTNLTIIKINNSICRKCVMFC